MPQLARRRSTRPQLRETCSRSLWPRGVTPVELPLRRRKPLTVGKYRRTDCSLSSLPRPGNASATRGGAASTDQLLLRSRGRIREFIGLSGRVRARRKTNDILIRDKRPRRAPPTGTPGRNARRPPRFYGREREKVEIDNLEEMRVRGAIRHSGIWHLIVAPLAAQRRRYLPLYVQYIAEQSRVK